MTEKLNQSAKAQPKLIDYRVLWWEPIGGRLIPFSGKVRRQDFEKAADEAKLRREFKYRNVMIECRERSEEPWPRPCEEALPDADELIAAAGQAASFLGELNPDSPGSKVAKRLRDAIATYRKSLDRGPIEGVSNRPPEGILS